MPFSTFVHNVRANEVQAVAIEGRHVGFHLRPKALARWLPRDAAWQQGSPPSVLFRTVRPADYSTPYEAMLKHGVQFAAVEKQQSVLLTVMVRACSLPCSAAHHGSRACKPPIDCSPHSTRMQPYHVLLTVMVRAHADSCDFFA